MWYPHWEDMRMVPGAFQFAGVSDPTIVSWQPAGAGGTFKVYAFQTGDEGFFTIQIPHRYMYGTDMYIHLHWTPNDRGAAEAGKTVAWKVDYSLAMVGEAFPSSTTVDLTDTCDGIDNLHQRTVEILISGAGITDMSAMFVCRVYRDAGDTWAGVVAAQSPLLLEVDIHFQSDAPGSLFPETKQ